MGNSSGINLEFIGKCNGLFGNVCGVKGLLGKECGKYYELMQIIWEIVCIHTEPLETMWGFLVGNLFVGRGPNTKRTHPHACGIHYKTALPVPCTHRFIFELFLVTF